MGFGLGQMSYSKGGIETRQKHRAKEWNGDSSVADPWHFGHIWCGSGSADLGL